MKGLSPPALLGNEREGTAYMQSIHVRNPEGMMILTVAWINVGDCHQEARTKVSQQLLNPSFLRWRHQEAE
jgi:hypothetical protein